MRVLAEDLDHVLRHTAELWQDMRGRSIFITGGTGFFGCWLLESFTWANDRLGLGASATVLTRNPNAFSKKAPHLAGHPAIRMHPGHLASFEFLDSDFAFMIHAAMDVEPPLEDSRSLSIIESSLRGTRRVLDFALASRTQRFLLASSGAVYGSQKPEMTHIPEDYAGCPEATDAHAGYGQAKRVMETLCSAYAERHGLEVMIPRCFTFVGPYLPFNANYAAANFIRDALEGGPIEIKGDGTPYRSYLYAADMVIWLWTILFKGQSMRSYNVGSEEALSIIELARRVAAIVQPSNREIRIAQSSCPQTPVQRYVPSTQRARTELALQSWVGLDEAIERTAYSYSLLLGEPRQSCGSS